MAMEVNYICPLKIPRGHELIFQRQRRYDNGFPQSLTLDQAVQYMEEELLGLPAGKISVFSNYDRLNNKRNRLKREEDTAITCEIKMGTRTYYMVCDKWALIEHNLYALHLTVRAIRNIVKWGVADYEALLMGFDAAGNQGLYERDADGNEMKPEWMDVLGLGTTASLDDANNMYRHRAKESSTNEDELLRLNKAIEEARRFFGAA